MAICRAARLLPPLGRPERRVMPSPMKSLMTHRMGGMIFSYSSLAVYTPVSRFVISCPFIICVHLKPRGAGGSWLYPGKDTERVMVLATTHILFGMRQGDFRILTQHSATNCGNCAGYPCKS